MILINVLHNLNLNSSVTMATYWVPDLPIIKGVSGHRNLVPRSLVDEAFGFVHKRSGNEITFGVPFSYLQMVPHMHDPAGI